jgi:hypothetical protein
MASVILARIPGFVWPRFGTRSCLPSQAFPIQTPSFTVGTLTLIAWVVSPLKSISTT